MAHKHSLKKKLKIIIPLNTQNDINKLPKQDRVAIISALKIISNMTMEALLSKSTKFQPVDAPIKLLCGQCGSKQIDWIVDKGSNEILYECFDCGERGWMTMYEYKKACKRFQESVFEINLNYKP
jgi:hypothetical protein